MAVWLASVALALAACRPWDTTYNGVIANLADGGTAGGVGGGSGGGSGGGGVGGGGGGVGGAGPCDASICLVDETVFHTAGPFEAVAERDGVFVAMVKPFNPLVPGTVHFAATDGGAWTLTPLSTTTPINYVGVALPTATTLAIGATDKAHVFADGVHSTTQDCGFTSQVPSFHGASAPSADEVWFGGYFGRVCRWRRDAGFEGIDFDAGLPYRPIIGLKVFGSGDGVTVGSVVYRWSAGQPVVSENPNGGNTLVAVDGVSPQDLVAAGTHTLLHFRDGGWVDESLGDPSIFLTGVFARASNDVWVVGHTLANDSYVARWDGAGWTQQALPGLATGDSLSAIAANAAGQLVAVGYRFDQPADGGLLLRYQLR